MCRNSHAKNTRCGNAILITLHCILKSVATGSALFESGTTIARSAYAMATPSRGSGLELTNNTIAFGSSLADLFDSDFLQKITMERAGRAT